MSTARELALKASTRQQAAFKELNAANDPARTTMDQVIESMERDGHVGRIEASPKAVKHFTEQEWALEQERRARERELNPGRACYSIGGV